MIELRAARPDDAAAIGALHVTAWHETYTGMLPVSMLAEMSAADRTEMWRRTLDQPDMFGAAAVIVVQQAGQLVGFGCAGDQRDPLLAGRGFGGEIRALYVLRTHQHRGIGRALLRALAGRLAGSGHEAASLWVLRANHAARGFYTALGGQIIGEKTDEQPDATLIELAYGWRDLSGLLG